MEWMIIIFLGLFYLVFVSRDCFCLNVPDSCVSPIGGKADLGEVAFKLIRIDLLLVPSYPLE